MLAASHLENEKPSDVFNISHDALNQVANILENLSLYASDIEI